MKTNNRNALITSVIQIDDKKYKTELVFVDLDGTLLDRWNKKISKKNFNAIKRIQKTTQVVISTGRSYSKKVKQIMKNLDIDYAICQNGAVVVDRNNKILKNIVIDKQDVEKVIEIVKDENLGFTINSEFVIYTNHWLWSTLKFLWRKRWKKIKKFVYQDNFINKIVVAGMLRHKKTWRICEKIQNLTNHTSVKTSGGDKIVEITNADATKGKAAQFIADILNIDIKKTIHIGDSENDSTTLGIVGALIAMKNSSTKLLNIATHLGPNYKRGGIAKLLDGDIELINKK